MCHQLRVIGKALAAVGAGEWFLSFVNHLVDKKTGFLVKFFLALQTGKLLPFHVENGMSDQFSFAGVTLSAIAAGKGLLPRVSSLVNEKIGFAIEAFPTLAAGKWLLPRVNSLVPSEVGFVVKAFSALQTDERLFPPVDPEMSH